MEMTLRAALIAWLAGDPALSARLNAVTEESPGRAALPWLALAASASTDWSTKDRPGREIRVALELHARGDRPDTAIALARAIEARVLTLPAQQDGFTIVSTVFLRGRTEARAGNVRATLSEFRFHALAA